MATYLIDYENVNKDGLNGVSRLTEKDTVIIFYSAKADRMTFGLHRRLNETKAVVEYRRVDVGGHNALDFQLSTYLGFLIAKDSSEEYCIVSNDRGYEFLAGFWRKPLYNVIRTREIAAAPQAEERRQQRIPEEEKPELASGTEANSTKYAEEPNLSKEDLPSFAVREPEHTELIVVQNEQKDLFSHSVSGNPLPEKAEETAASVKETGSERENVSFRKQWTDTGNRKNGNSSENPSIDKLRKDVEQCVAGLELADSEREEIVAYIGRYKTKLGLNNALVRKFGTQKAGEIYKSIKNLIRDKKGSAETKKPSQQEEAVLKDVRRYVEGTDLTEEELRLIASYVLRYKTRQGLNNALVRRFGSQKAGVIYKQIRPLISGKKEKTGSAGKKSVSPEEDRVNKETTNLLSGMDLTDEDRKEIVSFVSRYKTKQGVNNALVRRFRSQKAGEIYKLIKPLLRDKKGRNDQQTAGAGK